MQLCSCHTMWPLSLVAAQPCAFVNGLVHTVGPAIHSKLVTILKLLFSMLSNRLPLPLLAVLALLLALRCTCVSNNLQ